MSSSNLSRERRIRSSHPSYILVFLLRGKTPPHIWTITSGDEIGNIGLDLQQRIRRRIRKQPTNVLRHVCQRNRLVSRLCPLMPSRKGLGQIALELNLFHAIWRMISRSVRPADNLSRNCACSSRNRCLGDFLGDSDMTLSPFL